MGKQLRPKKRPKRIFRSRDGGVYVKYKKKIHNLRDDNSTINNYFYSNNKRKRNAKKKVVDSKPKEIVKTLISQYAHPFPALPPIAHIPPAPPAHPIAPPVAIPIAVPPVVPVVPVVVPPKPIILPADKKELEKLTKKLAKKEEEYDKLKDKYELERLNSFGKDLAKKNAKLNIADDKIRNLNKELDDLDYYTTGLEDKITDLDNYVFELNDKIQNYQNNNNDNNNTNTQLNNDLQNALIDIDQLKQEKTQADQEKADLLKEKQNLEAQNQQLQDKNAEQKNVHDALLFNKGIEIDELKTQIVDVMGKMEQMQNVSNAKINNLENSITDLKKIKVQDTELQNKLNEVINNLRNDVQVSKANELTLVSNNNNNNNETIRKYEEQIKKFKEDAYRDIQEKEKNINALKLEIKKLADNDLLSKVEIAEYKRQISALENDITNEKNKNNDQIRDANKTINELKQENEKNKETITLAKDFLEEKQRIIDENTLIINDNNDTIATLSKGNTNYGKHKIRIEHLKSENKQLRNDNSALKEQMKTLNKKHNKDIAIVTNDNNQLLNENITYQNLVPDANITQKFKFDISNIGILNKIRIALNKLVPIYFKNDGINFHNGTTITIDNLVNSILPGEVVDQMQSAVDALVSLKYIKYPDSNSDLLNELSKYNIDKLEVSGEGKNSFSLGLSNIQIDDIMEPYRPWFKGTYSIDQMKIIPVSKEMGFILNLSKLADEGTHWVACNITRDSIEYYDSYGEDPPEYFDKWIKFIIQKINPSIYLKFKVNRIVQQRTNSATCGFFAMKFLMDRYNDKPFKESSGYSDVLHSEREINKFKNKFNYI